MARLKLLNGMVASEKPWRKPLSIGNCGEGDYILSFVPFKEAAKTSTLSKHWHHQWQSTRNLDFNHLYFANRDSNGDVQLQPQIFIDFVQQFIANNNSPIMDKILEEADLDFGPEFECDESLGDSLYQSLNGICPTRALTVCTYMLQVIPMGEEPTGMEPRLNVTHLTLRTAMHNYEQGGIRFFLNSCPRLETLTIDIDRSRRICNEYRPPFEDKFEDLWRSSAIIFRCITQTLRKVEIKGFKGTPNEVYVMLYLVNHARVMEKLTVITSKDILNENLYENKVDKWQSRFSVGEPYRVLPGDNFVLADFKTESVSDLQRVGRSWGIVSVTKKASEKVNEGSSGFLGR
ncbi:unnamed protein product [Malus baccata var. baccata]